MTIEKADFDNITDGDINGGGVFDEMMRSVKAHLIEEYKSNRIRGAEYANVYLNSIQQSMAQSIQWDLGAQVALNQALLIEKQIEGQEKQNELIDEQILQIKAQTALTEAQTANTIEEGKLIPKQGELLNAQIIGAGLQNNLLTKQIITEGYNGETAKYNLEEMLPSQKVIMDQKLITEEAQTQDTHNGVKIEGVTGAQRDLYNKQNKGYDRDAEQKATRALTDTYGVLISSDLVSGPDAVHESNITSALTVLRENAGLGTTITPPDTGA